MTKFEKQIAELKAAYGSLETIPTSTASKIRELLKQCEDELLIAVFAARIPFCWGAAYNILRFDRGYDADELLNVERI